MSVPTLFARISSLVMNHSMKGIRSRNRMKKSRGQQSEQNFTQIVEEMEQRILLSGVGDDYHGPAGVDVPFGMFTPEEIAALEEVPVNASLGSQTPLAVEDGSPHENDILTFVLDFKDPTEADTTDIFGNVISTFDIGAYGFAAGQFDALANSILAEVEEDYFDELVGTVAGPVGSDLEVNFIIGDIGVAPAGVSEFYFIQIGTGTTGPHTGGTLGVADGSGVRAANGANGPRAVGDVVGSVFTDAIVTLGGLTPANALTSGNVSFTTFGIGGTLSHEIGHTVSLSHIDKAGSVQAIAGTSPIMGTGAIDLPNNDRIQDRSFSLSGVDGQNGNAPRNHVQQLVNAIGLHSFATDSLSISIAPATVTEAGTPATGTVIRSGNTVGNLVVSLSSNDVSEATVPANVTILAGQTSATFPITPVEDLIIDGTQTATITASAIGFLDGTRTVDVIDNGSEGLNFIRLDSLGSQVFADQDRQVFLNGAGDEVIYGFYGQAGEIFSAVVTPNDPLNFVTLEIVELNQAFSSTAEGQPLIVSGEPLPFSQLYSVRITSAFSDTITLDTYLNATLEQQAIGGDSSLIQPIGIDDSHIDFGVGRYAIVGRAGSVNDVDAYTVDLSGQAGKKVEVVLSGLTQDFGNATLELQDQFGTTLAIASATPLGIDPTNVDLAILEFVVPANGIYRLQVTSPTAAGEYVLAVVTDSIGFEIDPNNSSNVALRDITFLDGVTGHLSNTASNSLPFIKPSLDTYLNLPPAARTAFLPAGVSYEEFLATLAEQPKSSTFTDSPLSLINVTESESNNNIGSANQVPLGLGAGEDPNVRITGSLVDPPVTVIPVSSTEDNGDINRATDTNISSGQRALATGSIGDGPFASTTGDFDFYALRNLQAGARVSVDVNAASLGSTLDSFIAVYDSAGNLVASNDDDATSLDSALEFTTDASGDFFVAIFGYNASGSFIGDPFNSGSGPGIGSTGVYEMSIGIDASDIDFFEFSLDAGDILGAWNSGAGTLLSLYDSNGQLLMQSSQNATGINPTVSPLRNNGVAALSWVTDTADTYYVSLSGGTGSYELNLDVFRPELETQAFGNHQILFLDFDGATLDPSIFGGSSSSATLSGLSSFLGNWGLTAADENAVIDAVIASVTESLSQDIRVLGNNGDFATTGNNGEFDIEILNSRDDADPFGQRNVSRLVIGGTIAEFGISTIGIAESIDVGNFETEETAVILLDLLSAGSSDPNSLNQFAIAQGASKIDLIGTGVGNIAAHEAGHYFGNWHTDQFNNPPNIMDQGGNLANSIGVGPDFIWGTADDIDVDFGDDTFVPNEGFVGTEDTLNVIAFGLSTGNTFVEEAGPRVTAITPMSGISGVVSTIELEFSESITNASALNTANYELISAGADGLLNTADDVVITLTPTFDGDNSVVLTINPADAPLVAGSYQLTIDGDQAAIRDLDSNPLNSINGGPGSDTIHQFEVAQPGVFPLDVYTVTLNAGEALFLQTSTPLDDPLGNPLNNLDPALVVSNPDGSLAASDDNSAADGRNAQLSFIATQTGIYEIEVSARSGEGEYVLTKIINHPPDIVPDAFTIPENSPVGTFAGTATATDVDGDNLTFAIIGGNPNDTFAIDPTTGVITVSDPALLDFETIPFFDLVVEVTDDGVRNLTDTAIIRINLTDVNEEPVMIDQTFAVDENSPNGTFVGQMTANDVDAGDVQTYTIVSGNTNNAFVIDPATGIITVNDINELNHEVTPQYSLLIRSTDSGGLFDEAIATINVLDINDQPVVDDQNFTIAENSAGGTSVGTVVATDEDVNPSDTLTYAIVSGNTDGAFAINPATGEITVLNPLAVNFEVNPSFDLLVQVTDDGVPSLNDTAIIHIDVINRNDGVRVPFFDGFETYPVVNPPATQLPPTEPWITNSTNVGRAFVTDAYQPFEGSKHLLLDSSVVDNQGSLNEVVLEVNPSGADQLFFEYAHREFLDEDQPMPAIFTGSSNSDGIAISSDGNTWYRLVSLTGAFSTNQYQQRSHNLTTFAGEVGLDLTQNFFIKLQQFDQFPVGSDGIAFDNIRLINRSLVNLAPVAEDQLIYLNENPLQDLVVTHVQATDPNPGDALLYEIVSGNDTATETGVFSINPATGEIRVDKPAAVDADTNPVFRLGIRVSDSGTPALNDTAEITIQVKGLQERVSLFEDDFESGTLAKWTTTSTALGRILNTTGNDPAQGARHLTFDSTTNSATQSLNEAIFSFDGTGSSEIILSMYQREFNDEDHPLPEMFAGSFNGDGISISVDGTTWYRVQSLIGSDSIDAYQRREYDLSALAAQKGLDLSQTVQVKIQAYDNFAIPFDGMAFDDVLVDANTPSQGALPIGSGQLAGLAIENGQLNWYVTSANGVQANGTSQLWGTAGAASQGVAEVKTGDFNGDGREDVALQNNDGEWFIGLSDETSFNQFRWTRWNTDNTSFNHVVVGDFNNDGRDDLLGMADNGIWWAAEAQGTQFGNKSWTRWSATANWQEVQVGDFNNDGYDDIAGRTAGSAWWVGLSNGTQFQNSKFGKWSATANWQDVSFGDFNGDGMTDITGRAGNGKWWTGLSDGTKFVTTNWAQWSSTTNWQDVNVGDFNGDGLADITGRAGNGKWWTAISNGTGFATTNWGQWSSTANWNDVVVGDFNADGTDDIAGRLDTGYWWNALSQGNSFSNQQGVQWNSALNWVAVTVGDYDAPAIPVTPPPAASLDVGPDFGSEEESDNEEEENLILQYEFENGLLEQNEGLDAGNQQEAEEGAQPADLFDEAAVEDLFGDQSLLDLLADLG